MRSISRISNANLDAHYAVHKSDIIAERAKAGGPRDANEKWLFHGAPKDAVYAIADSGFDNRYVSEGMFGYGFYFAENPNKPDWFARRGKQTPMYMLYCSVLCGEMERLDSEDDTIEFREKTAPDVGHHSVGLRPRGRPRNLPSA